MTYKNTRRAQQETGPLQSLFIGLLLVSAAGFVIFSFYNGLIDNYDTPSLQNESSFEAYQGLSDNTTDDLDEIRKSLQGVSNGTSGATDIIFEITTRGFSVLVDMLTGPIVIVDLLIEEAGDALGIPLYLRGLLFFGVLTVIIFAIVALIMKVRA